MVADICTAITKCDGGQHYAITIAGRTVFLHASDIVVPLADEELELLVRLAVRHKQFALNSLLGRVVLGDEATNMKSYNFLGPGMEILKNNIGINFANVLPGVSGQRALVDCRGCMRYRFIANLNLIGTGPFGIRVVRDTDDAVFYAANSITLTGEREIDTSWQPLPVEFAGLEVLRLQAKSAAGTDQMVFRRVTLLAE